MLRFISDCLYLKDLLDKTVMKNIILPFMVHPSNRGEHYKKDFSVLWYVAD